MLCRVIWSFEVKIESSQRHLWGFFLISILKGHSVKSKENITFVFRGNISRHLVRSCDMDAWHRQNFEIIIISTDWLEFLTRPLISMGSIGSMEVINIQRRVPRPINLCSLIQLEYVILALELNHFYCQTHQIIVSGWNTTFFS